MSQPKLSFGLKLNPTKRPAVKPKPSAFGQDDDDEAPPPAASTSFLAPKPKISTATLSRTQKAKQAADIALDSSVYEYDEVYDNMKQGARLIELDKKKDANDRKVLSPRSLRTMSCADALSKYSQSTFLGCWKRQRSANETGLEQKIRWFREKERWKEKSLPIEMHS